MEFFPFIFIAIIVSVLRSAANPKKRNTGTRGRKEASFNRSEEFRQLMQKLESAEQRVQSATVATSERTASIPKPIRPMEGVDPCHDEIYTPRAPEPVQLKFSVEEARRVPHQEAGMKLSGPAEGVDPCHDETYVRPIRSAAPQQPSAGWKPDFSPESMMQAVVMQEILTRPADRRRRA